MFMPLTGPAECSLSWAQKLPVWCRFARARPPEFSGRFGHPTFQPGNALRRCGASHRM